MTKTKLLHGTRTDRTKPATLPADPWNELSDRILTTLRSANSMTASEIAHAVGVDPRKVQEALIDLDDQERVHMRNGWYALSASERAKRG